MRKNPLQSKFQVFGVFWSRPIELDQFITNCTLNWYQTLLKTIFFKKAYFCIFNQKTWIERQLFWKTAEYLPIKMHIFRQKFVSMLLALGQKLKVTN